MQPSYESRKNQQFLSMLKPAQDRLKTLTPEEICRNADITFDQDHQMFSFNSLGQMIHVSYPDFVIKEDLEMWHHLTLLQYMFTADGTDLRGEFIGLQQMKCGISRGRGYDKDIETMFARYFSATSTEDFLHACEMIGGRKTDGKADATAVIMYAPRFPIMISFWEADDEFPASGKAIVDRNADHYLTIEAAGGACSAVIEELRKHLK